MRGCLRAASALALLVLASPANASTAGDPHRVEMLDNVFAPRIVRVPVGGLVEWTNEGRTLHNVTADDGAFASANLEPGEVFATSFGSEGAFPFHCSLHGSPGVGMTGVVLAGDAPPPGADPTVGPGRETPPGLPGDEVRVPEDAPTIQAGVDSTEPGGIVLIAPGVYREAVVVATATSACTRTTPSTGSSTTRTRAATQTRALHRAVFPCHAVITDVLAEHNALGFSGTNAGGDLLVVNSEWRDNLGGIVPNTLDSELLAPQHDAVIAGNWVHDNNDRSAPAFELQYPAFGIGILVSGGRSNLVTQNLVEDHETFGIALAPSPDERLWLTEGNVVRDNLVRSSGEADLVLTAPRRLVRSRTTRSDGHRSSARCG